MAEAVVGIDHGAGFFMGLIGEGLKQLRLGFEIGIHRAVVVEVVLREIRENSGIEFNPAHAALDE